MPQADVMNFDYLTNYPDIALLESLVSSPTSANELENVERIKNELMTEIDAKMQLGREDSQNGRLND
jgi:hypothetical protein